MEISLRKTRLGLLNSTVRIPFRYGTACLSSCPQAVLEATIEAAGTAHRGYSGDCLPPSWFDKSPNKNFAAQIDDMLAIIRCAESVFLEVLARPRELFPAWLEASGRVHQHAAETQLTPLLASFGVSLVERAAIDALCRAAGLSFARAVRANLFGVRPGEVHARLAPYEPADWLPRQPEREVFVRHTVGLGDPLTTGEIPAEQRLNDGFPQSLEQYIQQTGTRYFKIKVANQLDRDLERLTTFAALVERHRGADYHLTLDGNEQYKRATEFEQLVDAITAHPALQTLWENLLAIEQPLERTVALDPQHAPGIGELSRRKPVIIDESDGDLDSYAQAIEHGYRGVSSKNCKGPIRSLLNSGLTWELNGRGARTDFVMTGEDLCSVGVIPVQADLCLAATLGLRHVERNGHHFHPGLSYLPPGEQRAALASHPDFYTQHCGRIAPRLVSGTLEIGSLVDCAGFGFGIEPDMAARVPAEDWQFSSLGL